MAAQSLNHHTVGRIAVLIGVFSLGVLHDAALLDGALAAGLVLLMLLPIPKQPILTVFAVALLMGLAQTLRTLLSHLPLHRAVVATPRATLILLWVLLAAHSLNLARALEFLPMLSMLLAMTLAQTASNLPSWSRPVHWRTDGCR